MSKFTLDEIGYLSDPVPVYSRRLAKVRSLAGLTRLVKEYAPIAWDAVEAVKGFQDGDFEAFLQAVKDERAGRFCGDDAARKFGAVFMPEPMLRVGMVAAHFGAPWGCAFIRMKEDGHIYVDNGRVQFRGKQP